MLSATLFIIYIADIPVPPIERQQIGRLQYADDMLIYLSTGDIASGERRLNCYLATLCDFYTKWKIKINGSKSEVMVFRGPTRIHNQSFNRSYRNLQIIVDDVNVPLSQSVKYLGVTLTSYLKSTRHID